MRLTVVIPTRNRCQLLTRVLEALCTQTAPQSLEEVIVVSDGSTDDTVNEVAKFEAKLPIRLVIQEQRGVSAARNAGLRLTRTQVVLFLDDDVVPGGRLIEEHAGFHQQSPELESVLQGYVTWHPEIRVTPFMRWYGENGGLFAFSRLLDGQRADPRFLYTCNLSLKADFLRQHGGFDERLTVLEDHELGHRLAKQGMKMSFRRAALGYHYQSFTFDQACERLGNYSPGLPAFLVTEAGKQMAAKRERAVFRIAEAGVRLAGAILSPFRFLVDSDVPLPNALYRLFYWNLGTCQSFWRSVQRVRK